MYKPLAGWDLHRVIFCFIWGGQPTKEKLGKNGGGLSWEALPNKKSFSSKQASIKKSNSTAIRVQARGARCSPFVGKRKQRKYISLTWVDILQRGGKLNVAGGGRRASDDGK